jgi:hypothetical protein
MTPRAYLLCGFLFMLLIMTGWANAETIPSTPSPTTQAPTNTYKAESGYGAPEYASSVPAACQQTIANRNAATQYCGNLTYTRYDGNENNGACYGTRSNCAGESLAATWSLNSSTCPTGTTLSSGQCIGTTYTCPAGYSLSADSLFCSRADCSSGRVIVSGIFNGNTVVKKGCQSGCQVTYSGTEAYQISDIYGYGYIGKYTATGQTCSTTPEAEPETPASSPPSDPPTTAAYDCAVKGMSYGEVNGVTLCVPAGTPSTPPIINNPETTKTEDPATGNQTEVVNEDTVSGGNVTRTSTTTVRNSSGDVVSTATTTTTASQGAFCEQNPNSTVCKDSKVLGGVNCDAEPTASGDAIQAAILKQTWNTRCEAAKTAKALGDGSEKSQQLATVGEQAMTGEPYDRASNTQTINVANQISTQKFLSGSGLQDKVITGLPMGKTLTIPFSRLNQYLQIFGNLMVIIAMLAAARIVGVF